MGARRAATAPEHPDPSLRSRRYAVPFDAVWREALKLADGGRPGWSLVESDDTAGTIRAEARSLVLRFVDDVEIRVGLDADALTSVDLSSASRVGKWDLGANARRIRAFYRRLERRLETRPVGR